MIQIPVKTAQPYSVVIGNSLLSQAGDWICETVPNAEKVAIISDSIVWPLYGQVLLNAMHSCPNLTAVFYVFPAGETQKNSSTYLEILNFLASHQFTRSDCLIALGGGVVGDLTGFAAATYLRGIPYIQIPTTLLAAVDSSVGGKTAIDLPAGKNLAGAFYQPRLVLCDTDTLNTLPEDIFRDGCAEVIKYAILFDPELFSHLASAGIAFDREKVIARCVELKRDVVSQDEFDRGLRQKLNLGHTVGHAVEALSHFSISHGKAVAIGTAIVSRSACALGFCQEDTKDAILSVLERFQLPTATSFHAKDLTQVALSDKKRAGSHLNLIIPREIGNCAIHQVSIDALESFIEAGL